MYCPKGVLNVHNFALDGSSFTCQNPELASRTENTLEFGTLVTTHWVRFMLYGFIQVTWVYANSEAAVKFDSSDHAIYPVCGFFNFFNYI